ncbi:MAG: hypothetical protein ACOZAM_16990 [Pseudomonadota bacterium]
MLAHLIHGGGAGTERVATVEAKITLSRQTRFSQIWMRVMGR